MEILKDALVVCLRVDFPQKKEVISLPKTATISDLKKKAATFIETKVPIQKYTLSWATCGSDVVEYNDEKDKDSKLEDLGIRSYCTVFLVAPDDIRELPWEKIAAVTQVFPELDYMRVTKLLKQAKGKIAEVIDFWRKALQLREVIPYLDDVTIMEELNHHKGNVDAAITALLGGDGGKGKGGRRSSGWG
eukprot:TRINITY_DN1252_c1_g1_i5.p1 TRINITY_DN1252_c1_g1~~TRINITY_DN1252_c1_g1_i5.p1  ORF type:complete len:209 (+),score=43.42 TRINITY_DN1252_c1_g1_i5:59-628(+)